MLGIAEHSHAILVANWLYLTRNVSVPRPIAIIMWRILCYCLQYGYVQLTFSLPYMTEISVVIRQ